MSNWVLNSSGHIPFNSSVGPSSYAHSLYANQGGGLKHGSVQAASTDAFTSQRSGGFIDQQAAHFSQPVNSLGVGQRTEIDGRTWQDLHNIAGHPSLISAKPLVQAASGIDFLHASSPHAQKIMELEQALQSVRSELSQQHEERRTLRSEVDTLQAELTAERQRSNDLSRQLHAASAAHNVLQLEYDRLISQHAATVREHELMTDSLATALREQETRRADVARLQRQLDEAQAAAAIAGAAAATASTTTAALCTTNPQPEKSARRTSPRGVGGGGLSTAEEERWSLRLQKAERALEEERRVSEDLRHQLVAAEAAARMAEQLLRQLEIEIAGGGGSVGSMLQAASDPLPLSPGSTPGHQAVTLSSASPAHAVLVPCSSGAVGGLAGIGAGGSGGGSGGSVSGGTGSGMVGGYRPVLGPHMTSSGFVRAAVSAGSGLGALGVGGGVGSRVSGGGASAAAWRPGEDQLVRMRKEVEGLRSDVARLMAEEEAQRVAVRAAEDRARAAESVSLDIRRQCDQAARTIGRLIDENSELVAKVNAQANALADCKTSAAAREAQLRALESHLQEAQSQLAAAQPEASGHPDPPLPTPDQPPSGDTPSPEGTDPSPAGHGSASAGITSGLRDTAVSAPAPHLQRPLTPRGAQISPTPPHASPGHANTGGEQGRIHSGHVSREVLLPGGPPSEADWKLVMLAEEVRRLVEEVSLANTACMALQQLAHGGAGASDEATSASQGTDAGSGSYVAPSSSPADALDLPRILSRLAGLAGRRLGPGETAAYIIELAGHMEALERVLAAQQQRMAGMQALLAAGRGAGESGLEHGAEPAHVLQNGATMSTSWSHEHAQSLAAQQQQLSLSSSAAAGRAQSEATDASGHEGSSVTQGLSRHGESRDVTVGGSTGAGASMAPAASASASAPSGSSRSLPSAATTSTAADVATSDPRGVSPPSSVPAPSSATAHPVVVSPFHELSQHAHSRAGAPHGNPMDPHACVSAHGIAEAHQADHRVGLETDAAAAHVHVHRPDLAAAAAAAVAAAAMVDGAGAPPADGAAHTHPTGASTGAVVPCEASQLPRVEASSGSGTVPARAGVPAAGPGVLVVGMAGVEGLDDDLLGEEMVVVKARPRKTRVGLWGWISGETVR